MSTIAELNDATTTAVSIDTSAPGEPTIVYTVTSPTSGLTGSIMRTAIVSPADQSSEPASAHAEACRLQGKCRSMSHQGESSCPFLRTVILKKGEMPSRRSMDSPAFCEQEEQSLL
jgi:hypothetical protein